MMATHINNLRLQYSPIMAEAKFLRVINLFRTGGFMGLFEMITLNRLNSFNNT